MRLALALCALFAAPASAQSPATAPSDYEAQRGAPFGEGSAYAWSVTLDGEPVEDAATISVRLGEDWALWRHGEEAAQLVDLRAGRYVTIQPDQAGQTPASVTNSSLYAEARRRIDIYAGLSQGGSREEIAFGPGQSFHRIWLEAAMGVAAQPGALEITRDETGLTASHAGSPIVRAWFAVGEDSPCNREPAAEREAMIAMMRHGAPLHPDIFAAFREHGAAPCALDFTVISPESPQGRTERWRLVDAEADGPVLPLQAEAVLPRAELIGEAGEAAAAAVRGEAGAPQTPADFYEAMLTLRSQGDLAGAFLLTVQETHHFGPCPDQAIGSARLVCAELNALTQAGVGDADFERAVEGLAAVREERHGAAVDALSGFLDRDDRAGAAARILVANELVAWGREGLAARPDLDPAALLGQALVIDPFAPDVHWHLGRRYLEAGAPHAAWAFFDLARALPGRAPTPLLEQTGPLEGRLSALAPDLAPVPAGDSVQMFPNGMTPDF